MTESLREAGQRFLIAAMKADRGLMLRDKAALLARSRRDLDGGVGPVAEDEAIVIDSPTTVNNHYHGGAARAAAAGAAVLIGIACAVAVAVALAVVGWRPSSRPDRPAPPAPAPSGEYLEFYRP